MKIENNITVNNFFNCSYNYSKKALTATATQSLFELFSGSVYLSVVFLKNRKFSVIKSHLNDIHKKSIRYVSMYFAYHLINSIIFDVSLKIINSLYKSYNKDKKFSRIENKVFKLMVEVDRKIENIFVETFNLIGRFNISSILMDQLSRIINNLVNSINKSLREAEFEEIKEIDLKKVINPRILKNSLEILIFYKLISFASSKLTNKLFDYNFFKMTKTFFVICFTVDFFVLLIKKNFKENNSSSISENVIDELLMTNNVIINNN